MVKLCDVTTGRELLTIEGHKNWIAAIAWSPDGHRLASAGRTIRIWDATLPPHDDILPTLIRPGP
jgi:WD40 repeat protein